MILYPPLIEDVIPAFTYGDSSVTVTVPYSWNDAVPKIIGNEEGALKMRIQIKDYFSSAIIYKSSSGVKINADNTVSFTISKGSGSWPKQVTINGTTYKFPEVGQYYKIQIAYDDGDSKQFTYSAAALTKCLENRSNIVIGIQQTVGGNVLTSGTYNNSIMYYGYYSRKQLNEPLYSYRFDLLDASNKVIETSGDVIWNNEQDSGPTSIGAYISQPSYKVRTEINTTYKLKFSVTTINLYTTSATISIKAIEAKEPICPLFPRPVANLERGSIQVNFHLDTVVCDKMCNIMGVTQLPNTMDFIDGTSVTIDWGDNNVLTSNSGTIVGHFTLSNNIGVQSNVCYFSGMTAPRELIRLERNLTRSADSYTVILYNYSYFQDYELKHSWSATGVKIISPVTPNSTLGAHAQYLLERRVKGLGAYEQLGIIQIGANDNLASWSWEDFTVEPGVEYEYSLRQFKDDAYSIRMSNIAKLHIEDIFLQDATQQLAVRFNPKVSSMKEVILESKADTIGGKYPVFYRNGQVRYREIPVSGLISYLMDSEEQFIKFNELSIEEKTTSIIDSNRIAERTFRERVLAWLNNGKAKIFRSETEGAYIVRLMNVSLSPNDTLGRMLWTFSATAYEFDTYNLENLIKHELIDTDSISLYPTTYNARSDSFGG